MSMPSSYDERLEETVCPNCWHEGVVTVGGLEWECQNCGHRGSEDIPVE